METTELEQAENTAEFEEGTEGSTDVQAEVQVAASAKKVFYPLGKGSEPDPSA